MFSTCNITSEVLSMLYMIKHDYKWFEASNTATLIDWRKLVLSLELGWDFTKQILMNMALYIKNTNEDVYHLNTNEDV